MTTTTLARVGCRDFTCGLHGSHAAEAFDPARHCRKCWGAARNVDLARSLNRDVLFADSPAQDTPTYGAGTELKKLLAEFGVTEEVGCSCNARASVMDTKGIDWCKANRSTIAGWLREEAGKRSWVQKIKVGVKMVASGFVPNPTDPYGSIVDEAIRRAEVTVSSPFPVSPLLDRIPSVVFASHDLSLSGAPTVLANVIPHLRGLIPSIYSPKDGPLTPRFAEAGVHRAVKIDKSFSLVVANTIVSVDAVRQAKRLGIPCVWLVHEYDPVMCGNVEDIKEVIDYPTRIVFPCQEAADNYRHLRDYGVEIVPSVIPPVPERDREECRRRLGLKPNSFVILTFGNDEPRKGQEDIRAAIAGMDVVYLSVSTSPDPHTYLAAADVYICSSRVETYSLSLQEAKAHGLPVITTPVDGYARLMEDGKHCIKYAPGDIKTLRAAIKTVRAHPRRFRQAPEQPSFAEVVSRYEAVFKTAVGLPSYDLPINVVYHVASMGHHWRTIVGEQLDQLRACGLGRVLCTHVGEGSDWLTQAARARGIDLVICSSDKNLRLYESPAIRLIERLVKTSDKSVLYLHSKGVSHPLDEEVWHVWRRLLMKETVGEWRRNLAYLKDHDAVGVNWWFQPGNYHFSGNFWLATAEWLRRLPKFDSIYRDRYSPEVWIGLVPGCRAKSLVCSDKRFWDRDKDYLMSLPRPQPPCRP